MRTAVTAGSESDFVSQTFGFRGISRAGLGLILASQISKVRNHSYYEASKRATHIVDPGNLVKLPL